MLKPGNSGLLPIFDIGVFAKQKLQLSRQFVILLHRGILIHAGR
jgi:hypothetical protein